MLVNELLAGNFDAELMSIAVKKGRTLEQAEAIYIIMKLKEINKNQVLVNIYTK